MSRLELSNVVIKQSMSQEICGSLRFFDEIDSLATSRCGTVPHKLHVSEFDMLLQMLYVRSRHFVTKTLRCVC